MTATATQLAKIKQVALWMAEEERQDLSREAGRTLTVRQAHEYRLRKLTNQSVAERLEGK